ncbi:hypothetical protein PAXRUDRAFT_141589, partial [Paxillus rubicundulus Ve08.2h10]
PFAIHLCSCLCRLPLSHCLLFSFPHLTFAVCPSLFTFAPMSLILPSQWLLSPVWFSLTLSCSQLNPSSP